MSARSIPADFDYSTIDGLNREMREKLSRVRPQDLAMARPDSRDPPAAVSILNIQLEMRQARHHSGSTFCEKDGHGVAEALQQLLMESSVPPNSEVAVRLKSFLILLEKWNSRINLASSTEWRVIGPMIREAIWAAAFYPPEAVSHLDIGSGEDSRPCC